MPIARVTLEWPVEFEEATIFYPASEVNLASLNIIPNDERSRSLAEVCSASSRVDRQIIEQHATVAFPIQFDWEAMWRSSHESHMEFIRFMSEAVDDKCLNLIRYWLCQIDPVDALPGKAGQLVSNYMMSAALLYNAARQQGRIIGGAAFTHFITKGLGLPIEPLDPEAFPKNGEVGNIARRFLSIRHCLKPTTQLRSLSKRWRCLSFWLIPTNTESLMR
jgi:hypothetical protein